MRAFLEVLHSMYDISSTLFLYKFVFIVELFMVELMIGFMLKKRKHFILRLILVTITLAVVTFLLPIVVYQSWYLTVLFIVMFAISLLLLKVLYNETFKNLFVCGIFAYSTQHITYSMGSFITTLLNGEFYSIYGQGSFTTFDMRSFVTSVTVFLAVCGIVWVFILFNFNKQRRMNVNKFFLVNIAVVMILANVILNAIVVYQFTADSPKLLIGVYYTYDILTAAMVIALLCFAIYNNRIREEMKIISILREKDKQIYNIKKDKIDSINVMCHNLHHQLTKLRESVHENVLINEMEKEVDSYANIYKTGNNVLDIIMAENAIYCSNYDIELICMADGESLKTVSENALYSIFDNLLNNAVDATKNLKSEYKKFIKVFISKSIGGIVNISVENPYDNGCLMFEDGLPKTKNEGKLNGYGLRSVKLEVENLGGAINIQASDGIFRVNVVIPFE